MNAHLQAARDKLEGRRAQRQLSTYRQAAVRQHQSLKTAMLPVGEGRCFIIRYCDGCLRGTVIDLTRDADNLEDARDLGIKQQRPWSLECSQASSLG